MDDNNKFYKKSNNNFYFLLFFAAINDSIRPVLGNLGARRWKQFGHLKISTYADAAWLFKAFWGHFLRVYHIIVMVLRKILL